MAPLSSGRMRCAPGAASNPEAAAKARAAGARRALACGQPLRVVRRIGVTPRAVSREDGASRCSGSGPLTFD